MCWYVSIHAQNDEDTKDDVLTSKLKHENIAASLVAAPNDEGWYSEEEKTLNDEH